MVFKEDISHIDHHSKRWLSLESFEGEIWKDFPKIYEDCQFHEGYEISNYGRLKAKENSNRNAFYKGKAHICKTGLNRCGYECIRITFRGKSKTFTIHKIVAIAFVDNPSSYKEVNHKNEIKTDNRADNLEWCTRSYNMKFGTGVKLGKKRMLESAFFQNKMKPVNQYDMDMNFIRTFASMSQAAKSIGSKTVSDIKNCCIGKQKYAYGYKWKYANG